MAQADEAAALSVLDPVGLAALAGSVGSAPSFAAGAEAGPRGGAGAATGGSSRLTDTGGRVPARARVQIKEAASAIHAANLDGQDALRTLTEGPTRREAIEFPMAQAGIDKEWKWLRFKDLQFVNSYVGELIKLDHPEYSVSDLGKASIEWHLDPKKNIGLSRIPQLRGERVVENSLYTRMSGMLANTRPGAFLIGYNGFAEMFNPEAFAIIEANHPDAVKSGEIFSYATLGSMVGSLGKFSLKTASHQIDELAPLTKQAGESKLLPSGVGGTGAAYNKATGQGLYVLRDEADNIRYVGRGDAPARIATHADSVDKGDLIARTLYTNNLTEAQAKGLEQRLIDEFGGASRHFPDTPLLNKINSYSSINPNAPLYRDAVTDALWQDALKKVGR